MTTALLHGLLAEAPPCIDAADLRTWWQRGAPLRAEGEPVDCAVRCGWAADRLGWAFAGGYHAALRRLVPDLGRAHLAALCATEAGGAHPRAIESTLVRAADGWVLSGHKRWGTLATAAETLFVVASTGSDAEGRKVLRVARVPARAAGVTMKELPATPFAPEIPHAEVVFEGVHVVDAALLPGDGWERWVKPFRTVEDAHVHAAVLGYLLGVARRHAWPEATVEALLAAIVTVRGLALADPASPAVHIALAGLLAGTARLVAEFEPLWQRVTAEERQRWLRDRGLVEVAGRARAARRERAWQRLESPAEGDSRSGP